jgi:hypothetical protein
MAQSDGFGSSLRAAAWALFGTVRLGQVRDRQPPISSMGGELAIAE